MVWLGLLALLAAASPPPAAVGRTRLNFDADWRFLLGDPKGAEQVGYADAGWRRVHLPHDWSIEGDYDEHNPSGPRGGFLPGGVGWYRKHFSLAAARPGAWVLLEFDGIYRNGEVWINGHPLGRRPSGYSGYAYEIDRYLRPGDNVLAVRVDDSLEPSDRWYAGCGIYRHVWLTLAGSVHVAHWGTSVVTPDVSTDAAAVRASVWVENIGPLPRSVSVEATVLDPAGRSVAAATAITVVGRGETRVVVQNLTVPHPSLWSPDTPSLYRLHLRLVADQATVDTDETPFGIRTFRFDAATGFWLNGRRVKWRGMALHQDGGALGAAVPDALLESRLRLLKAMGANAVRTAHDPFAPEFYDLCDRLGLMVMDEAFDGWQRKAEWDYGAIDFADWWRRDLAALVERDSNHPSVILWSIGNETGSSDRFGLAGFLHKLDPSRPVTGGQVLTGVDVAGWNGRGEVPGFAAQGQRDRPMILTECPHTFQTRGFYRTQTWWRDADDSHWPLPDLTPAEIFADDYAPIHPHRVTYNSSYDNAGIRICIRQSLERTRDTDFISGENRWTAFDYLGESFGWPLRMGNFGIIDSCGFPKDAYYLYQSQWTTAPMLHLLPLWTHPTLRRGTIIPVWAYTNCDTVELFLNGRSRGRRRPGPRWDEMNASWDVPYEPGVLRAVGWRNGRQVAEETVRTAGAPARLRLETDNDRLQPDGEDLAQVAVAIQDSAGNFVPYASNRVHFALIGPGVFRGSDNGDPADLENSQRSDRRAFYGLCKAYVGSSAAGGPVLLGAAAILGDRTLVASRCAAIDVRWVNLRGRRAEPKLEIRYTTDGTVPDRRSARYSGPFAVGEGTVVKAVAYCGSEPVFRMAETFSRSLRIESVNSPAPLTPRSGPISE